MTCLSSQSEKTTNKRCWSPNYVNSDPDWELFWGPSTNQRATWDILLRRCALRARKHRLLHVASSSEARRNTADKMGRVLEPA